MTRPFAVENREEMMRAFKKTGSKRSQTGIKLVGCQMFLTGSDECPRFLMSTKYYVPIWGIMHIDTKGARFFDASGRRLKFEDVKRRLWKYFQQDDHHRRQLGHLATATMAAGIGQPIPDPDIADVEPPSGFWASVTGSVNEVAEGGLWRDPGSNEIGGILAYTASCKATEVWIELNPHELVVSDSDSIA